MAASIFGAFRPPPEGLRGVSSVGSEHYLDKVGVTGSSPVRPTQTFPESEVTAPTRRLFSFLTI